MKLSTLVFSVFCAGILAGVGAPLAHAADRPVLTITANNATTTWGSALPTLTLSYSGFIDADEDGTVDDENYLDMLIVARTSATASSSAGTYTITPDEPAGGGDFVPSSVLTDSVYDLVLVNGTLTILKTDQLITNFEPFLSTPFTSKDVDDTSFQLSATTTSGLTPSFVGTGACTVTGTTTQMTLAGVCTITASQAGDTNWNAAPSVIKTFDVTDTTPVVVTPVVVATPVVSRSGGGRSSRARVARPAPSGQVLGASTYYFAKDLYFGDESQDVLELQKILIADRRKLDINAPSGFFGRKTQEALRLYQAEHGVRTTGNAGPLTRAFLNAAQSSTTPTVQQQIATLTALLLALQAQLPK